ETAAARERLMAVYDLSRVQADHILELRLRQLTKYSRIELEKEQEELRREIAELEETLASDSRLRALVSAELAEIAEVHGDDRRTELLESEALPAPAAAAAAPAPGKTAGGGLALEITDAPCWVFLSTSGQLARTPSQLPLMDPPRRIKHD